MRIGMGIVLLLVMATSGAQASNVDWNLHVNVGSDRAAPPPAPYPPPEYYPPGPPPVIYGAPPSVPVIVSAPPLFLVPANLGFWVAVDVPYDMVFIDGYYYLHNGHYWYASSRYNGPWRVVAHERLPPGLRRHKFAKIRDYRDKEYKRYQKQGAKYRGQPYWPEERGRGEHPGRGKGHYR
jgi:hypothetical protein